MEPTISGRMTMSLRRFRRDCCLRRRPRFSLLLWRAQYSCISCSLGEKESRESGVNFLKVRFFLISTSACGEAIQR
ncbi:hypothetical protein CRUP_011267 [Coryphaenoides rupestris]|nr:hypothetical protein CRUP_011267 [Coryphaenoides rupestris]